MTDKDLEELADEKAYEPSGPQRNTLSRGSMFEVTRRNVSNPTRMLIVTFWEDLFT